MSKKKPREGMVHLLDNYYVPGCVLPTTKNMMHVREVVELPASVDREQQVLEIIREWKFSWMNQTQNSKQDFENYHRRAFGVDANMMHDLARRFIVADATRPTTSPATQKMARALEACIEHLEIAGDNAWDDSEGLSAVNGTMEQVLEALEAFKKEQAGGG